MYTSNICVYVCCACEHVCMCVCVWRRRQFGGLIFLFVTQGTSKSNKHRIHSEVLWLSCVSKVDQSVIV